MSMKGKELDESKMQKIYRQRKIQSQMALLENSTKYLRIKNVRKRRKETKANHYRKHEACVAGPANQTPAPLRAVDTHTLHKPWPLRPSSSETGKRTLRSRHVSWGPIQNRCHSPE